MRLPANGAVRKLTCCILSAISSPPSERRDFREDRDALRMDSCYVPGRALPKVGGVAETASRDGVGAVDLPDPAQPAGPRWAAYSRNYAIPRTIRHRTHPHLIIHETISMPPEAPRNRHFLEAIGPSMPQKLALVCDHMYFLVICRD